MEVKIPAKIFKRDGLSYVGSRKTAQRRRSTKGTRSTRRKGKKAKKSKALRKSKRGGSFSCGPYGTWC